MHLWCDWAFCKFIPGMWTILQLQFSSRYRVSQSMRQALMLYVEKYSESMGVDLQSPHGGGRYWSCNSKRHILCLRESAGWNEIGHKTGPGQVQRRTTSRQNPTHISNINESIKPINKIEDKSISMATDTALDKVHKFRPVLSVTRQAVMQKATDAGLVPGRKQNTMGLETGSR